MSLINFFRINSKKIKIILGVIFISIILMFISPPNFANKSSIGWSIGWILLLLVFLYAIISVIVYIVDSIGKRK